MAFFTAGHNSTPNRSRRGPATYELPGEALEDNQSQQAASTRLPPTMEGPCTGQDPSAPMAPSVEGKLSAGLQDSSQCPEWIHQ